MLVALAVAGIFVHHVWDSSLSLGLEDGKPDLLGLHCLLGSPLLLILLVQLFKLVSPAVGQSRGLVGAEERPVSVFLYPLHEEVGDPKGKEQVPSSLYRERQEVNSIESQPSPSP